jgi:hypothetical protein
MNCSRSPFRTLARQRGRLRHDLGIVFELERDQLREQAERLAQSETVGDALQSMAHSVPNSLRRERSGTRRNC